VVIKWSLSGH